MTIFKEGETNKDRMSKGEEAAWMPIQFWPRKGMRQLESLFIHLLENAGTIKPGDTIAFDLVELNDITVAHLEKGYTFCVRPVDSGDENKGLEFRLMSKDTDDPLTEIAVPADSPHAKKHEQLVQKAPGTFKIH